MATWGVKRVPRGPKYLASSSGAFQPILAIFAPRNTVVQGQAACKLAKIAAQLYHTIMRYSVLFAAFAMLFLAASTEQQVPLDSPATSRPVSAQMSQLSAVDPTGRGALLVSPTLSSVDSDLSTYTYVT